MTQSITLLILLLAFLYSSFWNTQPQHNILQQQVLTSPRSLNTDVLQLSKNALTAQTKFLGARIEREYTHVQHLHKSTLGIPTNATIAVTYAVEYSLGYNLQPDSFMVSGSGGSLIQIVLKPPELIANPAVRIISHDIQQKGFFINEQEAIISLQQQLHAIALNQANILKNDLAINALCEKRLTAFLQDFLLQQNVGVLPSIKITHK